MTNYIDNTTDDATTYKGKIDESLNLLRGIPVTAGTGTAYTVADWSSITLTNGFLYVFRAHTDNTGACTVESVSVVNAETGSALTGGEIQANNVYFVWYDSSGPQLRLINPSIEGRSIGLSRALTEAQIDQININGDIVKTTSAATLILESATDSVILRPSSGAGNQLKYRVWDPGDTDIDGLIPGSANGVILDGPILKHFVIGIKGNDIDDGFYIIDTNNGGDVDYAQLLLACSANKFAYKGNTVFHAGNLLDEDDLSSDSAVLPASQQSIKAFSEDAGNITTGTLDSARLNLLDEDNFASNSATDPASQQSIKAYVDNNSVTVVAEESFSIGGAFSDTGYARSVRGSGGNWIDVYLPIMAHTSQTSPASASGDLPAAYRPGNNIAQCYTATAQLKEININNAGTIIYDYYDFSGSSTADTSTRFAASLRYFEPD